MKPSPLASRVAKVRLLFLVLIPLALAVTMCGRQAEEVATPSGLRFKRPLSWTYLTATRVEADDSHIHFPAAAVVEALAQGHGAPLFAVIKYPHPHGGINPMIGVNVSHASGRESPLEMLDASVAEVQKRSDDALEVLEPITATTVAGHAAARVVLHAKKTPTAGPAPDKMTVVAVVTDNLSLMIAASGAFEGEDAVDAVLDDFLGSFALDGR